MFTARELAPLLAALQFWRKKITQSGAFAARPYLKLVGMEKIRPLEAAEINHLSAKLRVIPTDERCRTKRRDSAAPDPQHTFPETAPGQSSRESVKSSSNIGRMLARF